MPNSKANVENIYPLTPMQEGMLFHALLEPRSTAYFEQLSWRVRGALDVQAFEASWNDVIQRHGILRSRFVHEGADRPLQVVLRSRPITLHCADLRGTDAPAGVAAFRAADRARPFGLDRDPLVRVALLRLSDDEYEIVWSHHHIVLDGWSVGLVIAELLDAYRARRAGQQPSLPQPAPFSRFVKWLQARDHDAAVRFWSGRVGDCTERSTVPYSSSGTPRGGGARGAISFGLGLPATAGLQALASKRGVTLAVVLQAIWALLLGRYTDADDVVFGSVVSGRPPEIPAVDRMVGNFINTIPVRVRLDRAVTFDELLAQMHREAAEADPHQHVALSKVQSLHRLEDGLFGTLVSLANYPVDPRLTGAAGLPDPGFTVDAVSHIEQTHYDLDLQFVPAADLQVRITYDTAKYEPAHVAAIQGHMRAIAAAVISREGVRLDEIDVLTDAERVQLLGEAAHEARWAPQDTLNAAFERQAALTPARVAVSGADGALTYEELNARANQVAHALRNAVALEPDVRIGVMLDRTTELAVGLLGVLKAGAAYVPLERTLPRERAAYMLEDAGCQALLCGAAAEGEARVASRVPVVLVNGTSGGALQNPVPGVRPSDLAYVIYTSGSTGRPKGVMIEHHSVVNLVQGLRAHVYDRHDGPLRVALLASYAFDASVQQIFAALLLGHTLVVVDEAIKKDGIALNRFLVDQRIDIVDGTPTLLQVMARSAGFDDVRARVRHALIGGEPLPWSLMEEVIRPGGLVVSNVYGPTECCVDATARLVDALPAHDGPHVPVGRPLPNVHVLVVGRTGHLVPQGARGEICIAGAGVGRGYVGDEALTARKFVRLPSLGGLRAYRTADAGRVLPGREIDCLGRMDDQVKVRGFRIELGEIEHQLAQHPGVRQAAAYVARGDDGDELRATLVLSSPVHVDELRAHLGESLPEQMIPSRFYQADELPRTGSGKLDRKGLAAHASGMLLEVGSDYAAPVTPVERALAEAWRAVLGVERVGIDDNYFSLGGDSIKAIQILSRLLRQQLKMEIRDLFRHRTIRSLTPFVQQVAAAPKTAAAQPGAPMLTAAQARFLAEHRVVPGHFHHAVLLESRVALDPAIVGRAFAAVRDHHEALRWTFGPAPRIGEAGGPPPDVPVFRDVAAARAALLGPFDLAAGPLHRLGIVRPGAPNRGSGGATPGDRLLIVVHHLCIDGVSWRILVEDLAEAIAALGSGRAMALAPVTDAPSRAAHQLAAFAASTRVRDEQFAYWRDVETRAHDLWTRGARPTYGERTVLSAALDAESSALVLTRANAAYNTTPEDLLLTALARAFHLCMDKTGYGVLLESHGRYPVTEGADLSRTVGWFTSLYPFVLAIDAARDLGFQVKSVKEGLRAVPDHGVGYGVLRHLHGAALSLAPQVSFNYLGQIDAGPSEAPLRISPELVDGTVDPGAECLADLDVSAVAVGGRLHLQLAFGGPSVARADMEALLDGWRDELLGVAAHCASQSHTELTPADLSCNELTLDEIEDIFK